jgi:hypothetical protein
MRKSIRLTSEAIALRRRRLLHGDCPCSLCERVRAGNALPANPRTASSANLDPYLLAATSLGVVVLSMILLFL